MPTDLTKVKDHPAVILRDARARNDNDPDNLDRGLSEGEDLLREYEQEHKVTFAALDNDALDTVRKAYEAFGSAAWDSRGNEAVALADAVADLLGLADD